MSLRPRNSVVCRVWGVYNAEIDVSNSTSDRGHTVFVNCFTVPKLWPCRTDLVVSRTLQFWVNSEKMQYEVNFHQFWDFRRKQHFSVWTIYTHDRYEVGAMEVHFVGALSGSALCWCFLPCVMVLNIAGRQQRMVISEQFNHGNTQCYQTVLLYLRNRSTYRDEIDTKG